MTPSWYDVLDVDPTASPEEIRTAWKASIADLEPSDRRFKRRSSAAEVLLDPERRAAHDADLAADLAARADRNEDDTEGTDAAVPVVVASDEPRAREKRVREPRAPRRRARLWLVPAVLAVVAVLLLATTAVALTRGSDGRPLPTESEVAAARSAAESAVVPILSYDYRRLDDDQAAAGQFMTDSFREEYDSLFAAIEDNAPRLQAVVTGQFLSSGIVRTGPDQVDVLAFANQSSARGGEVVQVFRNQLVLQMVDRDGQWLVDCLITTAGGSCDD